MVEELELLEKNRKELLKKNRILILIGVLFVIAGVLGIFFEIDVLVFVIFLSAIFFIIAGVRTKKFANEYKSKIVNALVKDELGETAEYKPNGMISLNEMMYPGFVKTPDRHHGEDYVRARYNDVDFEMCDIRLEERHVRYDSKGHRHVSYETYFKGRYFIFDFNKEMNRILYVMPGRGKATKFDLEPFDTESMIFNKKFNAFAQTKEDGFYLLTPKMIERMIELSDLYKGSQYYAFIGGKLYVAINNNSDSLEVSVRKKIDESALKKTRGDLRIGPAIINEFGLDKSKFTKDKIIETEIKSEEDKDREEILADN